MRWRRCSSRRGSTAPAGTHHTQKRRCRPSRWSLGMPDRPESAPGRPAWRLGPRTRKGALTVHIICSVGWVGAVLVYLALGVWAVRATDAATVAAAWAAMALTGWVVIVPLAVGSLVTGILVAAGSAWGLLRHYWVVFALVVTVVCVAVLLAHMPSVSHLADQAAAGSDENPALAQGDLPHPAVGLVLLLAVTVLNVYKPRGLTRRGRRAQVGSSYSSRA